MSTLTKVIVVLLVVFSIAFTTMTVSMVARTANWRELATEYQQHAEVADTNLRHMIAANAAELTGAKDAIKGYLRDLADLRAELQGQSNTIAQLKSDVKRIESEKSSAEAINRGLVAQLQSAEAARAEYRDQRDELEQRNIDLERRNIDLNDRVNELTARVAVMMEQRRQFEQQIHLLRKENEKLARGAQEVPTGLAMEDAAGAALPQVTALTPVAASPIRGHVVEASGNLITISVGAADGVKEDMVFVVHRGDQYLGDLKITLVDPNQSAGRVVGSGFTTKPGDQVTDASGLGSSRG